MNWFRKDISGNFLWPGFSENLRVLDWILRRANGKAGAIKTPLGYVPKYEDFNMSGFNFPKEKWKELFFIDKNAWVEELEAQRLFLDKFGKKLPKELIEEKKAFEKRLLQSK